MKKLTDALYSICITLWAGGLLAIGYVAVPVLFLNLQDKSLAGTLAGHMFAVGGWIALVCGSYLLLYLGRVHGKGALRNPVAWLVAVMLFISLIAQFGIHPVVAGLRAEAMPLPVMQSALAQDFARWHGVSNVLHMIQVLLGIALVVLQSKGRRP